MTDQALAQPAVYQPTSQSAQFETLLRSLVFRSVVHPPRVTAHVRNRYHVFDARTITRFYAANKYVCFVFQAQEFLLDESLASLETRLHLHGFARTHRRELVNLNQVHCVHRQGRFVTLETTDGQAVPVSRRLCGAVLQALQVRRSAMSLDVSSLGLANGDLVEMIPRL